MPGLNTEQVDKLKGAKGIDQTLLSAYKPVQPTISAQALTEPPKPVTVPPPELPSIPSNTLNVARNVSRDTDGFIAAQTAEAAKLKDLQATYGALGNEGSLSDLFKTTQEQYGVTPESFKELKDIQLQLTDMQGASDLTKTRIEGAAGQTMAQAGREVTQEDRENAVRSATLASRAAVLQGNIQTATALAKDAVNIAYQDRTLKAQNLLNQIEMVQGQVDDQTAQLLEQEKRGYEAELAAIAEVKEAVSTAMVNGATQSEMAQLTDPNLDDETKKALAQSIIARGAGEVRDLEVQKLRNDVAISSEELKKLRSPKEATRSTEVIDVDGTKQLIDSQTGEVIATFGPETTTNEIELARDTAFINNVDILKTHEGLNTAVGPTFLTRTGVIDTFTGAKDDFISSTENIIKNLTLNTYEEAKAKGMTFGAMSESEWGILATAATKLSQMRMYKDDDPNLGVVGYDASQADFLTELDVISNFGKMDALRKGAAPADIGVQIVNGEYHARNSDGSISILDIKPQ